MKTPDRAVKSAKRVLEVLRYFNPDRPEATVMDLARTLKYPQSSTSELLRSLVDLGYMHYDRHKRVYRPTIQVALLGAWVQPYLFRQGHLLPMLDEINETTGQLVALATPVGLEIEYIHVIQATSTMRMHVPQGARRPFLRSATGKVLLSMESDEKISKLAHRINAEQSPEFRVTEKKLLSEINQIRKRDYALSLDAVTPGGGMIAVPLPPIAGNQPLAIGLGGLSSVIKQNCDEYVAMVHGTINRYFNLATNTARR